MDLAISTEERLILSMLYGMWQTRGLSIIVGLRIPELLGRVGMRLLVRLKAKSV